MTTPKTCHHDPLPEGYAQRAEWMAKKARTHRQEQCPVCGLWAVWAPKKKPMTDAERARALRAAIRSARTLASELLSLGTLSPAVRGQLELDKAALLLMVGSASGYVSSIESAAAERAARATGEGR